MATVATENAALVPERKYLDDVPESVFRNGRPKYDVVNKEYLANKKSNWQPGSLPWIVESVVKTFEFEISHKTKAEYVQSFAPDFRYSQNGGPKIDGAELLERGSYNVLINDDSYAAQNFTFESSHDLFRSAFPKGFAWEVAEVLAGPPNVTFRWRHWGSFEGEYAGFKPTGKVIEMFGVAIARVTDDLKIKELEIYYDPTSFLADLTSGGKMDSAAAAGACPYAAAATKAVEGVDLNK
mmetsp:Transcript_26855/g.58600  ORF Transcript_26855/g.58600 Transcript_26855/m.58600 type:complete len:239 (+) Transcript_26855:110-826(+)|eukprot:CAMPEP_0202901968 /NCGR_PEP_ID=MMETSP1392-20130828/15613_1 /ASSEMBLY_ACC=CAM_ASM_000868 /TAXON_ID=225041 /ORGANISM="Chlamydomonas chlamydogama, Strain SAG 11-48b" /LENGTH=238 /DNA_ID=CAMNT_0049588639 /DNA_START=73 /DNA_END=789 /DNA_ORIENTATION=+